MNKQVKIMGESESTIHYEPATNKKILLYSSPRFGISIFMGLIDMALLFLYYDVYNLDPELVGTGLMLGKFSIAIFQFFMGWLSDHTRTRLGRRKPYIIILTPILAASFILLLIPGIFLGSTPSEHNLFIWFCVFNCLAQGAYSVTTVYQSWTAEQFSVDQRPKVSQYQNLMNFVGTAIVVLFSMLILTNIEDEFVANPGKIPSVYLVSIIIFTSIMFLFNFLIVMKIPKETTPEYKTKMLDDLKTILKNKNMILVCLMQGICSFTWAMSQGILLSYTENVLKITDTQYIIVAVAMILTMIGALFLWRKIMAKVGKKKTLLSIFLMAIVTLPLSLLGYFEFSTTILFGLPYIILLAISLGGWYLFPYIMYADLAEDDQKETGQLKAGIYAGFPSILLNIFQAFSLKFTTWILSLDQLVQNAPNTQYFNVGLLLWGPIGAIILVISLIYAKIFIKLDFEWEKN
ncbi:hypothetical protein WKT22_00683 [Candidatus Lokiarchaeum ossiferum]